MAETSTEGRTKSRKRPRSDDERPPVEEAGPARAPVCTVAFCPICMAITATQGAAPDALEHLLNAARELFLAARAVIDVRADDLDDRSEKTRRTLQRIDIA